MPDKNFKKLVKKIPDHIKEIPYVKEKLKWDELKKEISIVDYFDIARKLIGDQHYEEAIELMIEIQQQMNNFEINNLIRGIPLNEGVCRYVEYILENSEYDDDMEFSNKIKAVHMYFFKYRSMIGFASQAAVPPFDSRFEAREKVDVKGELKYAKKLAEIILERLPEPSAAFKEENSHIIRAIIHIFILNNDIPKAEELIAAFIPDSDEDKNRFYSALVWDYSEQGKYQNALSSARWLLDRWLTRKESPDRIKEALLFYINLLEMNESYEEAAKEYAELGELEKAAAMYEKAGMLEKVDEICKQIVASTKQK